MSTVKKGQITASDEWRKHLRPWLRRVFWKGERRASKADVRQQLREPT